MKNVVLSLMSLLMFTGCEFADILAPEDCGGISGGDQVYDECGVCGGDNSSCSDLCGVPNGDDSSCCQNIPVGLVNVEIETILTSYDNNFAKFDIKITNISNDTLKYEDRPIWLYSRIFEDSTLYSYCYDGGLRYTILPSSINPNETLEFTVTHSVFYCQNPENATIGVCNLVYKCFD